jgi:hypothetical protein
VHLHRMDRYSILISLLLHFQRWKLPEVLLSADKNDDTLLNVGWSFVWYIIMPWYIYAYKLMLKQLWISLLCSACHQLFAFCGSICLAGFIH